MAKKPKRRIMKEFSIFEISGVDNPAQAGATMSIMKSRSGYSPGEPAPVKQKEANMPKTAEELQAELNKTADDLTKAQSTIEDLQKKADRAEKVAALTDDERDYLKTLSEDAQEVFLGYDKSRRQEDVQAYKLNKEAQDPVIYKSLDGTEYRKSDDARLIELAKRDDARETELRKMREEAANAAFEKRAAVEFAKFKGDLSAKTELAKAIAGIKDDEAREAVEEMLKAAHNAVGLTLTEVGTGVDDYSSDDDDVTKSKAVAERKLDEMAKKFARDHKTDYAKAYTAVLETAEGQKLYADTL